MMVASDEITTETKTAIVTAGGLATISWQPDHRNTWIVSQVSAEQLSAPAGATCFLRLNGSMVTPLVPTADAAGGDPPVPVLPSDVLTVEWAGCTPGQVAKVIIFYTVL
jgi:hypothetical protein